MIVFDKSGFVSYVRNNDELYIDNVGVGGENDNFDNDMEIVNNSWNGDGVYCIRYGSRGEVDFNRVNFSDELNEWDENMDRGDEFRFMRNDIGSSYVDLSFGEEDIRCYFIIVEGWYVWLCFIKI